jgi:hypothetical protein
MVTPASVCLSPKAPSTSVTGDGKVEQYVSGSSFFPDADAKPLFACSHRELHSRDEPKPEPKLVCAASRNSNHCVRQSQVHLEGVVGETNVLSIAHAGVSLSTVGSSQNSAEPTRVPGYTVMEHIQSVVTLKLSMCFLDPELPPQA